MDVVKEIQRLKDAEAIRTLITRYAQAADAFAPPNMMAPLFSRAGIWHCEGLGHHEGRDGIAQGLAKIRQGDVLWTIHFNVSPVIDISENGESAKAFWYLWELARARFDGNTARENAWVAGWYHADVVREDGAWCFSRMDLTLKLFVRAGGPDWPVE